MIVSLERCAIRQIAIDFCENHAASAVESRWQRDVDCPIPMTVAIDRDARLIDASDSRDSFGDDEYRRMVNQSERPGHFMPLASEVCQC